uniref:Trichome birefringence-like C-terminal domain-containing protein n=1 Tax=Ananas comosus var. bracteatus TaxID=296719 RepID=A0A6V7QIE4_ANACO|nr:unnamed protein product [Ananas comosus var. bracteatus]
MDHWRKPSLLFELSSTTKRKALSGLGVGVGASLLILSLVLYVDAPTSSSAAALFSWFSSARSDAEPSKVASFSLGKEGAAVSESDKAGVGNSSNSSSPATDRFDVYKAHSGTLERTQDNATNNDTWAGVGWKPLNEKDGIESSAQNIASTGKSSAGNSSRNDTVGKTGQWERTANNEDGVRTPGNEHGFGDKQQRHQSTQLDRPGRNSSHGGDEAVELGERTEVGSKQIGGLSKKCDVFSGRWVTDDNYFPYYPAGSCPYLDDDFNCYKNGRPDDEFLKWRWQPYGCNIPRELYYTNANGSLDEKLRLDVLDETTSVYRKADVIVFNTGHWWTHEKTSSGIYYYQEGNYVHPVLKVMEAYKKALTTWARWIDKNINARRTQVVFRGYSLTHFRGGQWNSGGQCHKETEPIFNQSYLVHYPSKMRALEQILKQMKTPVIYLNISRLTDYRKDGHPSIYRMKYNTVQDLIWAEKSQDCSHWCLPGVPDSWNELLYASLLRAGKGSWRISS